MINFSTAIFDALTALVAGRVYPVTLPQEPRPTWPAIRYTPTGGSTYDTSCGNSDSDDQTIQIDAVATTYTAAAALAAQIETAMLAAMPCLLDSTPSADYDPETKTHRFVLLFTIQPSSN